MVNLEKGNLVFEQAIPKICIPVIEVSEKEILNEFSALNKMDIDLVEFRADYFEYAHDEAIVLELLKKIRKLYNKPLLFTLRTKDEGGYRYFNSEYYFNLNNKLIKSKLIDLIDIEFSSDYEQVNNTINLARDYNIITIISYHNFSQTPSEDEILDKFNKMMIGDIAKIAVMPKSEEDVLRLLSASLKLKKEKKGPFIAIAMGPLGIISRISCQLFGSCMTYASNKKVSAAGQIDFNLTKELLKIMHL